jgi:hypothetical protein
LGLRADAPGGGVVGLAAVVTLLLSGLGHGATVVQLTNEELTKRAEVILHGKCTAHVAKPGTGQTIVTEYTFEVIDFIKSGTATKSFVFQALGGKLEDRGYAISGAPVYAVDEEVILFLDAAHPKTGCRHAIGLAQGKFTVKQEQGSSKRYLVRDLGGLRLVDSKGNMVGIQSAEGPRLYLEPFLKEVRSYLESSKK